MLRITIDLIPFGSEAHKTNLATVDVVNDGSGNGIIGNYDVRGQGVMDTSDEGGTGRWNSEARVEAYLRRDGFLELAILALTAR